jgi:hypothetical protein
MRSIIINNSVKIKIIAQSVGEAPEEALRVLDSKRIRG